MKIQRQTAPGHAGQSDGMAAKSYFPQQWGGIGLLADGDIAGDGGIWRNGNLRQEILRNSMGEVGHALFQRGPAFEGFLPHFLLQRGDDHLKRIADEWAGPLSPLDLDPHGPASAGGRHMSGTTIPVRDSSQ